ncbi:uncharacterized protein EI90DRAFT_3017767 [Cantharellus anzutake]|uniref:uncharacterized protein n=1 Tax=Cantharellus anzutake TaxID=1750568 RepID=UPI001906EA3F|nr:uncharacterized protein EI90DRAFT_3017767 [Cantharellus anzutake]KAF8328085.1 hypothetical protein EI90DRAFT_3017767 [Cantharellus anzutake]
MIPTGIQYLIFKRWPVIKGIHVDRIISPVIYMYAGSLNAGVNSIVLSSVITGVVSQVWLRRYHPGWYQEYNYILGGALDGGAQTVIFILSFAVYGASGTPRPFPNWWGNPPGNNGGRGESIERILKPTLHANLSRQTPVQGLNLRNIVVVSSIKDRFDVPTPRIYGLDCSRLSLGLDANQVPANYENVTNTGYWFHQLVRFIITQPGSTNPRVLEKNQELASAFKLPPREAQSKLMPIQALFAIHEPT